MHQLSIKDALETKSTTATGQYKDQHGQERVSLLQKEEGEFFPKLRGSFFQKDVFFAKHCTYWSENVAFKTRPCSVASLFAQEFAFQLTIPDGKSVPIRASLLRETQVESYLEPTARFAWAFVTTSRPPRSLFLRLGGSPRQSSCAARLCHPSNEAGYALWRLCWVRVWGLHVRSAVPPVCRDTGNVATSVGRDDVGFPRGSLAVPPVRRG